MTVRVRGIYSTALTALLEDIVQASPAISERFDESFPDEPATVRIATTADRQGVLVSAGESDTSSIVDRLADVGRDAFTWEADLPQGAVYAGRVTETLDGGALVDCGDGTGFLPYSKTDGYVDDGDSLRVQVTEATPPWLDGRPVLDTSLRVVGSMGSLVRGGSGAGSQPDLADVLPADPPEGWSVSWSEAADDADLEGLSAALDGLSDRADSLEAALENAAEPASVAPERIWNDQATVAVWFGRQCRFELDDHRREVVSTMPGHHRIKAGSSDACVAVDFVESICDGVSDRPELPFAAVVEQFGPVEGDSVRIGHGKPGGDRVELGPGTVESVTEDGDVTVERELSRGGTYDALDVPKRAGDVATTKFKEGRWWYPTVYRGDDGTRRGTYVNICTPVEIFPDEVRYVDLYVDVVKHSEGSVERVDEDELATAIDDGLVTEELGKKARKVADAIERSL